MIDWISIYRIIFLFPTLILTIGTSFYKVIDFSKNCVKKELLIWGIIPIPIKTYPMNKIIAVGNNVKATVKLPLEAKKARSRGLDFIPHLNTNFYHSYKVILLTQDGKLFDLPILGGSDEFYQDSLRLAKAISNYFDIPLIIFPLSSPLYLYYLSFLSLFVKHLKSSLKALQKMP